METICSVSCDLDGSSTTVSCVPDSLMIPELDVCVSTIPLPGPADTELTAETKAGTKTSSNARNDNHSSSTLITSVPDSSLTPELDLSVFFIPLQGDTQLTAEKTASTETSSSIRSDHDSSPSTIFSVPDSLMTSKLDISICPLQFPADTELTAETIASKESCSSVRNDLCSSSTMITSVEDNLTIPELDVSISSVPELDVSVSKIPLPADTEVTVETKVSAKTSSNARSDNDSSSTMITSVPDSSLTPELDLLVSPISFAADTELTAETIASKESCSNVRNDLCSSSTMITLVEDNLTMPELDVSLSSVPELDVSVSKIPLPADTELTATSAKIGSSSSAEVTFSLTDGSTSTDMTEIKTTCESSEKLGSDQIGVEILSKNNTRIETVSCKSAKPAEPAEVSDTRKVTATPFTSLLPIQLSLMKLASDTNAKVPKVHKRMKSENTHAVKREVTFGPDRLTVSVRLPVPAVSANASPAPQHDGSSSGKTVTAVSGKRKRSQVDTKDMCSGGLLPSEPYWSSFAPVRNTGQHSQHNAGNAKPAKQFNGTYGTSNNLSSSEACKRRKLSAFPPTFVPASNMDVSVPSKCLSKSQRRRRRRALRQLMGPNSVNGTDAANDQVLVSDATDLKLHTASASIQPSDMTCHTVSSMIKKDEVFVTTPAVVASKSNTPHVREIPVSGNENPMVSLGNSWSSSFPPVSTVSASQNGLNSIQSKGISKYQRSKRNRALRWLMQPSDALRMKMLSLVQSLILPTCTLSGKHKTVKSAGERKTEACGKVDGIPGKSSPSVQPVKSQFLPQVQVTSSEGSSSKEMTGRKVILRRRCQLSSSSTASPPKEFSCASAVKSGDDNRRTSTTTAVSEASQFVPELLWSFTDDLQLLSPSACSLDSDDSKTTGGRRDITSSVSSTDATSGTVSVNDVNDLKLPTFSASIPASDMTCSTGTFMSKEKSDEVVVASAASACKSNISPLIEIPITSNRNATVTWGNPSSYPSISSGFASAKGVNSRTENLALTASTNSLTGPVLPSIGGASILERKRKHCQTGLSASEAIVIDDDDDNDSGIIDNMPSGETDTTAISAVHLEASSSGSSQCKKSFLFCLYLLALPGGIAVHHVCLFFASCVLFVREHVLGPNIFKMVGDRESVKLANSYVLLFYYDQWLTLLL